MNFWKRLLGRGCSHRFSWPRIGADGRHYQVCVLCGTAYEYDCTMMRRTGRLMVMDIQHGRHAGYLMPRIDFILRRQENSVLAAEPAAQTVSRTSAGQLL